MCLGRLGSSDVNRVIVLAKKAVWCRSGLSRAIERLGCVNV